MVETNPREELIKKYRLAGKIRFMCFSLLLLFLLLMKTVGGYSYINPAFISLIVVESIINQPYRFIIRRVNIYRFQYYQMITDIIAISWIIHYMGGIEAPLINIAYYVVILWAGIASTEQAVFFAATASAVFFSSIVICEHFGILPFISYYDYKMPATQMFSLLSGNISFMFAFGYFCAYSSRVIRLLGRKRQEDALRNAHKLLATGYLVSSTAHDILNYLASIKGYAEVLLTKTQEASEESEILKTIKRLEQKSGDLLSRLSDFSHKPKEKFEPMGINKIIADALDLSWPLVKYSRMRIIKKLSSDIPPVMVNKNQLQEAFVVFILNALDATKDEGTLTVRTEYRRERNEVGITFCDTGRGMRHEDLKQLGKPFFTTKDYGKGSGLGLATAYGIIARHNGTVHVESSVGKGTTFTINIPFTRSAPNV